MLRPHESLRRYPGFLMAWIGRRTAASFATALAPLGLHPRHFGALNVLEETGAVSQQDLGRTLGIDPSSMVGLLDELESRGLVARRRDPADRRANALQLTDSGRDSLRAGRRIAGQLQRRMLGNLDDDDQAELLRLLAKVAAALDDDAASGGVAAATKSNERR